MPQLSAGDLIAIVSGVGMCLANYFGMRAELKVMRSEMAPIVRWWNRIAENQANRMFIRSRAGDDETKG